MLTVFSSQRSRECAGANRRDFIRAGALGVAGYTLPNLLRAKALARQTDTPVRNKSVIWVWLAGGPTHVETFDPKMTAPVEYRSVTGEVSTPLPGVTVGGSFPQIAKLVDKMALVRSFAHGNSSHGNATRWVMTGYNDRTETRPSMGSIVARVRGTTNPATGMPNYLRMRRIGGDGPGFLGTSYSPFDPSGQARRNMNISVSAERIKDRRLLLNEIDRINRNVDRNGHMEGLDGFEQQAFELILGNSQEAFDVGKEDEKLRSRYGRGLGENLLKARRLCEAGCSFVTVSYGGWDMHGRIERSLKSRAQQVDQGVSALIEDLCQRGMHEDVLVVVTGEFGRTPKINKNAGRDHWGRLCTLALSGGGLQMGQVVGESSARIEVPATGAITPQDLMATIMKMMNIDPRIQFVNTAGRPVYMIEDGKPIPELV